MTRTIRTSTAAIFLVMAMSLGTTACSDADEDTTPTTSSADTQGSDSPSTSMPDKPDVTVPDGTPPATLQVTDIEPGDGAEARGGSVVAVQYVGKSWSTKAEFDASYNRGQPFTFTLGSGDVIAGWDEGLVGMKVGGQRQIVIPPDKGYGARGAGGAIGPNETLVFVVDLVSVR